MEVGVVLCVAIIIFLLIYMAKLEYRTSKSKLKYDQMFDLMTEERRMIKEDRVRINLENKNCKKAVDNSIYELNEYKKSQHVLILQYDELASNYINKRMDLLQAIKPDLKHSTSVLYQLEDLTNSKKKGSINSYTYIKGIDLIFDNLSR